MTKPTQRQLPKLFAEALGGIGFERKRQQWRRPAGDDFEWWLGVGGAARASADAYLIRPVVGVRALAVEAELASLGHELSNATVSRPLGYLLPENSYVSYPLTIENAPELTHEIAQAIEMHAFGWLESTSSLDGIRVAIDEGHGFNHEYRLPILLAIGGSYTDARQIVETRLDELGDAEHGAAKNYRRFAESFFARHPVDS